VIRRRWLRVELFLILLEATGRRTNAVRQLRWSDLQVEQEQIVWPAPTDKKRRRSVIPIPETLVAELRQFRQQLGVLSELDEWLFPSPRNPAVPVSEGVLPRSLVELEEHAGLPKLNGSVCHPYRRKSATE
jgi:integrase